MNQLKAEPQRVVVKFCIGCGLFWCEGPSVFESLGHDFSCPMSHHKELKLDILIL